MICIFVYVDNFYGRYIQFLRSYQFPRSKCYTYGNLHLKFLNENITIKLLNQ